MMCVRMLREIDSWVEGWVDARFGESKREVGESICG